VRPIRVEQTGDQKIALADLCGAADKLWQQCIQEGDCVFLGIVMAWIDIAAQCEAGNSAACAVDEQANKAYWECTEAEKDESCNKLGTLLIQTNTCGTSDTDTPQK
jgi:hypothetical protein